MTVALAAPASAGAQSAGDDQYTDPFQGQQQPQQQQPAQPQPQQPAAPSSQAPDTGAQDPGTLAAAQGTGSDSTVQTAQNGEELPRTGGHPAILLGAMGYAALLGGFALRRRLS